MGVHPHPNPPPSRGKEYLNCVTPILIQTSNRKALDEVPPVVDPHVTRV